MAHRATPTKGTASEAPLYPHTVAQRLQGCCSLVGADGHSLRGVVLLIKYITCVHVGACRVGFAAQCGWDACLLAWWTGMCVCTVCSSTIPASCNSPRTPCSYISALSDAPQARETEHTRVYLRPAVHAGEARVHTVGACVTPTSLSRRGQVNTWPCLLSFSNWPV